MCTPVYTTSDFNFTQLQDSYQHYDFGSSVCTGTSAESCDSEGCRWVADPNTGYQDCRLTLDGKKQLLADDNIPDAVAAWILGRDYGNIDFNVLVATRRVAMIVTPCVAFALTLTVLRGVQHLTLAICLIRG